MRKLYDVVLYVVKVAPVPLTMGADVGVADSLDVCTQVIVFCCRPQGIIVHLPLALLVDNSYEPCRTDHICNWVNVEHQVDEDG